MAQERVRIEGEVVFFNNGKNYGVINATDGQKYHIHLSQIGPHGTGFKALEKGEKITFEPTPNPGKPRPEAKRLTRQFKRSPLPKGLDRPEAPLDTVQLKVSVEGKFSFPKREESDPRDYVGGNIRAFYIGDPGCVFKKTLIAVDAPSASDNTIFVPVDDFGGILRQGQEVYDFPRGGFLLVVKIDGSKVTTDCQKIFVREQNSTNVIDEADHGVWACVQKSYALKLEIPGYVDERDLMNKLEPQISDPYGWGKKNVVASAKKFARGIVHAVIRAQCGLAKAPAAPLNTPFTSLAS